MSTSAQQRISRPSRLQKERPLMPSQNKESSVVREEAAVNAIGPPTKRSTSVASDEANINHSPPTMPSKGGTSLSTSAHQRVSRPSRLQKEIPSMPSQSIESSVVREEATVNAIGRPTKRSTSVASDEANIKARGRLAPRVVKVKQRHVPTEHSSTTEDSSGDMRKTNWRQYRQNQGSSDEMNLHEEDTLQPGAFRVSYNPNTTESDEEYLSEDDSESVTYPGAVRVPGPRADIYGDDIATAVDRVNEDITERTGDSENNEGAGNAGMTHSHDRRKEKAEGKKDRFWIRLGIFLVLVAVIAIVIITVVLLTGGEDASIVVVAPPTEHPTASSQTLSPTQLATQSPTHSAQILSNWCRDAGPTPGIPPPLVVTSAWSTFWVTVSTNCSRCGMSILLSPQIPALCL